MDNNQVYDQYMAFIGAYRPLSKYAVDLSLLDTDEIQYPRDYEIDDDEFFSKLYVNRKKQEKLITNTLLHSPNIVLIIGEKGSGKTCICRNISRELKNCASPKTLVISFDIRLEEFSSPITTLEPEQIDSELIDKLREKYLDQVFPFKKVNNTSGEGISTENPFLRLIAYTVDPNQQKPKGFECESDTFKLRLLFNQYQNSRPDQKNITYYDWLIAENDRDLRIGTCIEKLLDNKFFSVQYLAHATHNIYKYDRQCIIIDNVDTLSTPQQSRIQTVIKRLSSNISQIANVIVPVRDRNVFKQFEYDEFQAPPYQTYVRLYTPDHDEVTAFEFPKIDFSEIEEIFKKRLDYSFDKYNKLVSVKINLSSEGKRGVEIEASGENNTLYAHSIEKDIYENILRLSNKILKAWEIIKAPYLANNSIRTLLEHHCEFMAHLIVSAIEKHKRISKKRKKGTVPFPNFNSYGTRGVITEYLAWIRRSNIRENTIGFYDVIADKDEWLESEKSIIGFTLEHLIVTTTWNLTIRKPIDNAHKYKIVNVGNVIKKLEAIGYERNDILITMNSLYHEDEIRTHFIELQSSKGPLIITNHNEILDDYLIYVTPRGKGVSRFVINTFGYIFECVINAIKTKNEATASYFVGYINIDEKKAVDCILPHLFDVADMHISTLIIIRDLPNQYVGKKWMTKYLDDFGIPVKSNQTIGSFVNGGRKALQFETMLNGIIRFTSLPENDARLSALLDAYNKLIDDISNYNEGENISIKDLVVL